MILILICVVTLVFIRVRTHKVGNEISADHYPVQSATKLNLEPAEQKIHSAFDNTSGVSNLSNSVKVLNQHPKAVVLTKNAPTDQGVPNEPSDMRSNSAIGSESGGDLESANLSRDQLAQLYPELSKEDLDTLYQDQDAVPLVRTTGGIKNIPFENLKTSCPALANIQTPVYFKINSDGRILSAQAVLQPNYQVPPEVMQCTFSGGDASAPYVSLFSPGDTLISGN